MHCRHKSVKKWLNYSTGEYMCKECILMLFSASSESDLAKITELLSLIGKTKEEYRPIIFEFFTTSLLLLKDGDLDKNQLVRIAKHVVRGTRIPFMSVIKVANDLLEATMSKSNESSL